jgi:hypothetical protein
MNPKQNDADETEPPYPREHPGHHRGYSWRENNGETLPRERNVIGKW